MKLHRFLSAACVWLVAALSVNAALLELKSGDHIALLGGALPDRMQHHGSLETLITAKFPKHDLVFRNLAASADEVATWHRSENFGTRDQWLERVKADVIFAFYGFNESFKGEAGLEKFKGDLDKFIKETKTKNYSGKGAPRLVIFSPIANEKLDDANMPDPKANNERLKLYTAAMAEVAKANDVPFVDLFAISQDHFAQAAKKKQPLTINTFLLNEAGDKAIAPDAFRALFGETAPGGKLEKLNAAINEKNAEWHHRYRTVDGYNVYGGRSGLAFQPGVRPFKSNMREPEAPYISNYQTMQDEMKQRDVMTENRDKRVWAVAQGGDLKVDDSNLPKVRLLPSSNVTNDMPYLSGEETIKHIKTADGLKITLVADEVKFPELATPVQMAFDTKGRLWIAAWPSYPEVAPTDKVKDKLLIFDLGADGKAVKCTTWLDGLNCPTGFQFHKDGVLVMQAPDLWFVHDANGKAGAKERVLMGMDSADSHHTANSICYEPGGAIYLSDGVFHRTQAETAAGPVHNSDGCVYRFEPLTGKFERYVASGFANPHGRVFDYWGNDFITDATGNANYFAPAFSGYIPEPAKHSGLKHFWKNPSRPCPATAILSTRHFPEEFQGNFLNFNVIGFQGIYRAKFSEDGSGIKGESIEDLLQGDNSAIPNFRPICGAVAPDGSFYFCDWAKPLIGHMQHHIRDPKRDKTHGRIYRVTYEGRPLLKPVPI
ncbi:MAG: dehydrogenase, partial [Verrucomicrobia bacterium]|nr:dehydrogenase [Verrucomicrobiota bacterium]